MDILANIPVLGPIICEDYLPGNGCSLPMVPGHYGMNPDEEPFKIPIPNIPEFILRYLLGTWELKVEVYNQNLKEIMCVTTTLEYILI